MLFFSFPVLRHPFPMVPYLLVFHHASYFLPSSSSSVSSLCPRFSPSFFFSSSFILLFLPVFSSPLFLHHLLCPAVHRHIHRAVSRSWWLYMNNKQLSALKRIIYRASSERVRRMLSLSITLSILNASSFSFLSPFLPKFLHPDVFIICPLFNPWLLLSLVFIFVYNPRPPTFFFPASRNLFFYWLGVMLLLL